MFNEYLEENTLILKYTLKKKLENLYTAEMLPENVEIDFSTDGAQLSNSGTCQFWPIQFRVVNCTDKSDSWSI